ncbi:hypothetical protein cand_026450 [Cryptosporidium andersoni]|uniref:Gamma tubulin complex component C-terminal domain-containing protein n=1 Tax=Cryptosporidium andersoni TaxID=117008 RepID=A0A1J4MAU2_9CRYT|nr:hypothetical protein cand_026450 [Cryptosporidium andersoni]
MEREYADLIELPSEVLRFKDNDQLYKPKYSHFWLVNTILNTLISSNTSIDVDLIRSGYFSKSIFEKIRIELTILKNNLELVHMSKKENHFRIHMWEQLGNCITSCIIDLLEKWDTQICELQHHNMLCCEVIVAEGVVSRHCDEIPKKLNLDSFGIDQSINKDFWEDKELCWLIESCYPFKEIPFGLETDQKECILATPVTLIYLVTVLKEYLDIWSNIRSFFCDLVTLVFVDTHLSPSYCETDKAFVNLEILDRLFNHLEKSILCLDQPMIKIWNYILGKCLKVFWNSVPQSQIQSDTKYLAEFESNSKNNPYLKYKECLKFLNDLSSRSSSENGSTTMNKTIGTLVNISPDEIGNFVNSLYNSDSNALLDKEVDVMNIELFKSFKNYPTQQLFCSGGKFSNQLIRSFTMYNCIKKYIDNWYSSLNYSYISSFIYNGLYSINHAQNSNNGVIDKITQNFGHDCIRIIDVLICIRNIVLLDEFIIESLIPTMNLKSQKKFPNVDIDPTELNLTLKLLDYNKIKGKPHFYRKIISLIYLEFDMSNTSDYVRDTLPTYISLKIRLNMGNSNYASSSSLSSCGIPCYIISHFLSHQTLEIYSSIFTFLLEIKRSSIFLNNIFHTLTTLHRKRQAVKICNKNMKQNKVKNSKQKINLSINEYLHFESKHICIGDCMILLNWIDILLNICHHIRFSLQHIINAYYSYFELVVPSTWSDLCSKFIRTTSLDIMVATHEKYVSDLQMLILAPKVNISENELDQSYQQLSMNFILLVKLTRQLSILTNKMVYIFKNILNSKYRKLSCVIIRRNVQDNIKDLILNFELLNSNFQEIQNEFLESLRIYGQKNTSKELKILKFQLNNGIQIQI